MSRQLADRFAGIRWRDQRGWSVRGRRAQDGSPYGSRRQGEHISGKFVLKKGTSGKFHFNLLAGNGQVIATSEAYESKSAALNGIKSVQTNAPEATIVDESEN
jgi:hypothetical protein